MCHIIQYAFILCPQIYTVDKRGHNVLLKGCESNKPHKNHLSLFCSTFSNGSLCISEGKCTSLFFQCVCTLNRQPYSLSYTYTWVQMAPQSRLSLSAQHNHSLWQIFMLIIFEVVLMSFKILRTGLSIHCPV